MFALKPTSEVQSSWLLRCSDVLPNIQMSAKKWIGRKWIFDFGKTDNEILATELFDKKNPEN